MAISLQRFVPLQSEYLFHDDAPLQPTQICQNRERASVTAVTFWSVSAAEELRGFDRLFDRRYRPRTLPENLRKRTESFWGGKPGVRPNVRPAVSRRPRTASNAANVAVARGTIRLPPPRPTSGQAADALHLVFEAPAVSVSVRARGRSPLHAPPSQIRELQ
jgi:hypothetical protein